LTVTTADGCTATITKNVTVTTTPGLLVDFDINTDVQCLAGNNFKFTDRSTITTLNHNISDWKWYFGDGDSAMTKDVTHTYTKAGLYNVTLWTTETPGGTRASRTKTVRVLDVPVIYDTTEVAPVCEKGYLQVTPPPIEWNGNTPTTGEWLLGGRSFNPITTPVSLSDDGKLLQYRVASSICGDAIGNGVNITVNPNPVADYLYQHTGMAVVTFLDASIGNIAKWEWDFGDGDPRDTKIPPIAHKYNLSGTFDATLTVTTLDGCTATATKTIRVSTTTDLSANFTIVNADVQCLAGNNFIFDDKSTITTPNHSISDWKWYFGNGDSAMTKNATYTYTETGTYVVTLVVTERPGGTQSSFSKTVKVIDRPIITDATDIKAVCEGELLKLKMPDIDWQGNTPVEGTWMLDGNIFNPLTKVMTAADSGKLLQYRIVTTCGISISRGVTITVNPKPVIAPISDRIYCADAVIPEFILNKSQNVVSKWTQIGGDAIGLPKTTGNDTIPEFTAINNTPYPVTAFFEVMADNNTCQGNKVYFTITVNPKLLLISESDMGEMCSETRFNYTARTNSGDVTFNWIRPAIAGINNGTANSGAGATISEVLYNNTNNPVAVTYTIEMLKGNCLSTSTVSVTVKPTPKVNVNPIVSVCEGAAFAQLQCEIDTLQQNLEVQYNITFDIYALSAGFVNISGVTFSGNNITISMPANLSFGIYSGILTLFTTDGCVNSTIYQFHIQVGERPRIIKHPESVTLCETEGFGLSVTAAGQQLTYQWFKDGVAIPGATSPNYTVNISNPALDYGDYHVEVTGICGTEKSNIAIVEASGLKVLTKWTDVVFISNENDYFIGYQWYKDGKPVGKDGNYQSYMEEGGLDGTYYVKVTYADGTTEFSCPLTVHNKPGKRSVQVYPNPVQPYGEVTVDMSEYPLDEVENSKFEMFDMLGRYVVGATIYNQLQKVQLSVSKGTYMYRITTERDEMIVGKIIVY